MDSFISTEFVLSIAYKILPAIFIIGSHEYVKALASTKLGDNLPRASKRLTPNPLAHVDVIGLIFMIWFGYGFGRPVDTSPLFYKDKKKGTLIVYILPSLFTMLLGLVFFYVFLIFNGLILQNTLDEGVFIHFTTFFYLAADMAMKYALFQIVPIYPLDGSKILSLFLPAQTAVKMTQYEKILQIVLVGGIVFNLFDYIFGPIVQFLFKILMF